MILRTLLLILSLGCLYFSSAAQKTSTRLSNRTDEAWIIGDDNPQKALSIADSIRKVAIKESDYLAELNSINMLSYFNHALGNFDNSLKYAQHGLILSEKHKNKGKEAIFHNAMGMALFSMGDYLRASAHYLTAAEYFQKTRQRGYAATAYANIGMAYRKLSKFKEANTQYFKAAEVYSSLKDTSNLAGIYHSIGNVFAAWGRYDSAQQYYQKGLSLALLIKDKSLLAQSYNNLGYAHLQSSKIDSAILYLEKALHVREAGSEQSKVLLLQNIAQAWLKKGQIGKAELYLMKSLTIAKKHNMADELVRANIDYSRLLQKKGEHKLALSIILQTDSLAQKLGSDDLTLQALDLTSQIQQHLKNYNAAIKAENRIKTLNQKIFSQAENRTIREMEAKFQSSQRELKILSLEKQQILKEQLISGQRRFIILLVSASLILIILLIIVVRLYSDKRKAAKKIDILNEEMHHRVKNNLQTLSALFSIQASKTEDNQLKANIRENEMRLSAMNLIHKQLYQTRHHSTIQLDEFLKKLSENVNASYGRINTNLGHHLVGTKIDPDSAVAIGLLANEVLTNAFKYAKGNKKLEIELNLIKTNDQIILRIADNGSGFDMPDSLQKESFGLQLIKMMSAELNAHMQFINEDGTQYIFTIPIKSY